MAMRRLMGDEPGHAQALGQVCCAVRDVLGRVMSRNELTGSSKCGPGNDMTRMCAAERPEASKIASLRPTMGQDVDSIAVSAVVDVSSAVGRQQFPSNGWQRTLEYSPLDYLACHAAFRGRSSRKPPRFPCRASHRQKCPRSRGDCWPVPLSSHTDRNGRADSALHHRRRRNAPSLAA